MPTTVLYLSTATNTMAALAELGRSMLRELPVKLPSSYVTDPAIGNGAWLGDSGSILRQVELAPLQ